MHLHARVVCMQIISWSKWGVRAYVCIFVYIYVYIPNMHVNAYRNTYMHADYRLEQVEGVCRLARVYVCIFVCIYVHVWYVWGGDG